MGIQKYEKGIAETILVNRDFVEERLVSQSPIILHNKEEIEVIKSQQEDVVKVLLDFQFKLFSENKSLGIYSFAKQTTTFHFGSREFYQETDFKAISSKIINENRLEPFFYNHNNKVIYIVPLQMDNQKMISGFIYTYYTNPIATKNTILFILLGVFAFLMAILGARWVSLKTNQKINQLNNEINKLKSTGESIPESNDHFGVIAKSVNDLTEKYTNKHKTNKAILDGLPFGVIFYNANGAVQCVNETAEKITGFTKEEIIEFTSKGKLLDMADRVFWETLRSGETFLGFEGYCPTKSGIDIPVVTSTKQLIVDGIEIGRISTFSDVTEQKRLSKVEQRSKVMLDHISDGVITLNNHEEITSFNVGAEEITGLKEAEIKGKTYREVFDINIPIYSILLDTLYTGKEYKNEKREIDLKEGRKLYFIVTTRLLKNNQGKRIGTMGIYKEITPMIELEQQILRAEKLAVIGELAAGTAHEIRNPLTTIQGFIQLLGDSLQEASEKKYITLIISEIRRINQIIKEMLLLAKPSAPAHRRIKTEELIQDMVSFMIPEGALYNVILETRIDQMIPDLFIDEMQIKQVFINLIRNGIQSMKNGGTLKIIADYDQQKNEVKIQFIDQGEGIPPSVLKKIYDPFFTTKEEGTGLGIPISLQIMQNHEGNLVIESDVQQGTTVTITFPIFEV